MITASEPRPTSITLDEAREKVKFTSKQSIPLDPEPISVYDQAAKLVQTEKLAYEQASLGIRETIKRAYKNYISVYDEPIDPYTGRRKIFSPLTHDTVDQVAKPVDISAKTIRVSPLNTSSRGGAKILNLVLPYFFKMVEFDQIMKEVAHRTTWLGSSVTVQDWHYEEVDEAQMDEATTKELAGFPQQKLPNGKVVRIKSDKPRIRQVNLLDLYLPPTAPSIHMAVAKVSVILRSLTPIQDVWGNPLYDENARAQLKGRTFLAYDRYNADVLQLYALAGYRNGEAKMRNAMMMKTQEVPEVEVFERYGPFPKSWITKKDEDELTLIPGIITVASMAGGTGGPFVTLSVRMSPFGEKGPFEEIHFNKIPNRWYGEGIGERLIPLQAWHNEVINTRRNNEVLVQNKMFIYKRGKVDPSQFISRPGGGIAVDSLDHIKEVGMGDINQSTFTEDQNIIAAAERLAGINLTPLSKRMSATEVANQQANANITYSELRESMERYVERLLNNHLIPLLAKYFESKHPIPITLEDNEMEMLDTLNGYQPFESKMMGNARYLLLDDTSMLDGQFAVTADIEGATISRASQIQAINNAIMVASKIPQAGLNIAFALRKSFELSGLYDERFYLSPQQQQQQQQQMAQTPGAQPGEGGAGVGQLSAGIAQPNQASLLMPQSQPRM